MDLGCLPVGGDALADLVRLQTAHGVEFVPGQTYLTAQHIGDSCGINGVEIETDRQTSRLGKTELKPSAKFTKNRSDNLDYFFSHILRAIINQILSTPSLPSHKKKSDFMWNHLISHEIHLACSHKFKHTKLNTHT